MRMILSSQTMAERAGGMLQLLKGTRISYTVRGGGRRNGARGGSFPVPVRGLFARRARLISR